MNARVVRRLSIGVLLAVALAPVAVAADSGNGPGYVDGSAFRALIDENKEVVEVNLDGPILHAIAKQNRGKEAGASDANDLFAKLKSVHAVIGTVKGDARPAMELIQKLDRRLTAAGWQRIARIKDEDSWVSVLTHVTNDKIDGLVALIFDTGDKELVFANLAGAIDLAQIGEIGDRLDVPALKGLPGVK